MSRAIVMTKIGGPEVLQMADIAMPQPSATQVRVAVQSIGVNPVETYWRSGTAGRNPKLPYTPGRDCAGVVDAVGSAVTTLKKGDRVFTTGAATGTYAHHCLIDASDAFVLPDAVSFDVGATIGTSGMAAYRALCFRGQARPGEKLFVHGASGGVGLMAIQLARSLGLTVVGTADNQAGVDLIRSVGASHGFVHHDKDYMQGVKAHGPYDLVIECLANVNLQKDLEVAAYKGRVVIVGSRGPVQINPRDIMTKELSVTGLFLTKQTQAEKESAVAHITATLANGTVRPLIQEQLALEQVRPHTHPTPFLPSDRCLLPR